MGQKKSYLRPLIAVCLLVTVVAIMALVYMQFGPKGTQGAKKILVEVVIPDEKSKEYTLNTDAEFLRQALVEKDLIKGKESEFGLFISEVNGYIANEANQEWWCITKSGEQINYGVDQIAINDGDHYEITLTVGY